MLNRKIFCKSNPSIVYINLQSGYHIVLLLCVDCVCQPPIKEHDDDDNDDVSIRSQRS